MGYWANPVIWEIPAMRESLIQDSFSAILIPTNCSYLFPNFPNMDHSPRDVYKRQLRACAVSIVKMAAPLDSVASARNTGQTLSLIHI